MRIPCSTYRMQFNKSFTFSHLEEVLPYLYQLGVSTIYASPVFEAMPGSTHGYDVINPHRINPELGTEAQLRQIRRKMAEYGMTWVQDIVPNHMAFDSRNPWVYDLLQKGSSSSFYPYFDLFHEGSKLMVPFLGETLEDAIENGALTLITENGTAALRYYEATFPLNEQAQQLWQQMDGNPEGPATHTPATKNLIRQLCDKQFYRLCHWQETSRKINYRRFFTINGLIGMNMQDAQVFAHYHQYLAQLVREGIFDGLRIDHIDGLNDPSAYLNQLKNLVGEDTYVIVEKILQHDEDLPPLWNCEGTTGYDFLALVNNLFSRSGAQKKFSKFLTRLTDSHDDYKQLSRESKQLILNNYMAGELEYLTDLFLTLLPPEEHKARIPLQTILAELMVKLSVYRFYGSTFPLPDPEANVLRDLLQQIATEQPTLEPTVRLLTHALFEKPSWADKPFNGELQRAYKRLMQFTGPLMAKGVEDTVMYRYYRFVAHNEVGDHPDAFGISIEAFHEQMVRRQQLWPHTLNCTATHDTKRGEDIRARLNTLSEVPELWQEKFLHWRKLNRPWKTKGMPDAADEYFLYQTLVGTLPLDGGPDDHYKDRVAAYIPKALREGKRHTHWEKPNKDYEQAAIDFVLKLLSAGQPFLSSLTDFVKTISDAAIVNSLSQTVLKYSCPGVPDLYQGTELWDYSLVDPDNRRPVDYSARHKTLSEIAEGKANIRTLWHSRNDGRIKLSLTKELAHLRKNEAALFEQGDYMPLEVKGRYAKHILAFARRYSHRCLIVVVPLHVLTIMQEQQKEVDEINWHHTHIVIPPHLPAEFHFAGTDRRLAHEGSIWAGDLFEEHPYACLLSTAPEKKRGAGILLSITSLPGAYGVGDLGKDAHRFVDWLAEAGQKYWQLLPLNPTEAMAGHAPYSSYSAMAANPLLISPDMLMSEQLLTDKDLKQMRVPAGETADYSAATEIRNLLFEIAYSNFTAQSDTKLQPAFAAFCEQESYWLDDMALFKALKDTHGGSPWYAWESEFKFREAAALKMFVQQHSEALNKIKFLQFLFHRQWYSLRKHATAAGVQLFGDMPFYVSYDSVDVWANPQLFCLDQDGQMTGVAGVPPDYFCETGQLWGMPTYNWNAMRRQNYEWWIRRLKRNLEFFDLLRIDHFRAFQDYWQVPAGEKTAMNGRWLPGPGKEFFDAVTLQLGSLPFVAEDLGEEMDAVYELRRKTGLPGMKVLQFAWGENMPVSVDVPHHHEENSIVYTGTHDNNTTMGWYKEETNKASHKRMHHYLGLKPKQKNIHEILSRLAYSSVARLAILPMQDVLGTDAETRMNTPGQSKGNWLWRMPENVLTHKLASRLREWVKLYDR